MPYDANQAISYDNWKNNIKGAGDTRDTGLTESMGYFYTETQPTDPSKQCWHYVDGVPTIW